MISLREQCVEFRDMARAIWLRAQREPLSDEDRKNLEMAAFDADHTLQANPRVTVREEAA